MHGQRHCLVKALFSFEHGTVAEGLRVVLGLSTMGHLAVDASINETIRFICFDNNPILIVANHLRREIMHHSAPLSKLVVAWVLCPLSWQQSLTPINNSILGLNRLLTVEVEDLGVGVRVELKRCGGLFVESVECGDFGWVFARNWFTILTARLGCSNSAWAFISNLGDRFSIHWHWWIIAEIKCSTTIVVKSSRHRFVELWLELTLVKHLIVVVARSTLKILLGSVLMPDSLAPTKHFRVVLSLECHTLK